METISIIIPCYNEEEAIPVYYETMVRQAINSPSCPVAASPSS